MPRLLSGSIMFFIFVFISTFREYAIIDPNVSNVIGPSLYEVIRLRLKTSVNDFPDESEMDTINILNRLILFFPLYDINIMSSLFEQKTILLLFRTGENSSYRSVLKYAFLTLYLSCPDAAAELITTK